ncbi:MAG: hypothetical protein CVV27_14010 [Candidatus Melainabacteria bacterium HGW-Melainabacteria-1]|nr:MAG: hypothetical protein CVV27_14010 [Candidatus Melainabacteria bacterium HGW-Melainabacteria-1]
MRKLYRIPTVFLFWTQVVFSIRVGLIFLLACLPLPAIASESAWVLPRDSSYVEIQAGYGRLVDQGQNLQQMGLTAHLEQGFLETATLLLDFPFLTRVLERPGQTPATLVNNGLTDIGIGTRIRLIDEPFGLSLRGMLRAPLGYDPSFVPILGEHSLDIEAALQAGYAFYPLQAYVQGGLGYRFRLRYDKFHARLASEPSLEKPSDQVLGFVEAGVWILPQLFASLTLSAELGMAQAQAFTQSQLLLQPLLAWRVNPYVDLSLQLNQSLWSQGQVFGTQVLAGAHFRFGQPLERGMGLRGGEVDYAERDDSL